MAVTKLLTHIYFRLLQQPTRSTRQAAVHLILADLRAQLTAATEEGMAVVDFLSHVLKSSQQGSNMLPVSIHGRSYKGLHEQHEVSLLVPSGASEAAASLARFSLSLLSQDAVNRQFAAAIWAGLYKACRPTGLLQPHLKHLRIVVCH